MRYIRRTAEDMNKAIECVEKGTSVHKASAMFSAPTLTLTRRVLYGQPGKMGRKMSNFCFAMSKHKTCLGLFKFKFWIGVRHCDMTWQFYVTKAYD